MRISAHLGHVMGKDKTIFEMMDLLYDAGFRILDFTACDFLESYMQYGETELFSDNWKDWILQIKAYADNRGIMFNQSHQLIYNYFNDDQQTHLLNNMFDRVTEATALLGAPISVVHPVIPPGCTYDIEQCKEKNAAFIREKAKIAQGYGISFAVENMFNSIQPDGSTKWRYCNTPVQLVDLVNTINMPNVGFCFDVGHAHCMRENIYDSIMKYGDRLLALHIHDNDTFGDQHNMMFTGSVDWEAFTKGLADCQYKGDFTLESDKAVISLPRALQPHMLEQLHRVSQWIVASFENHVKSNAMNKLFTGDIQ